MVNGITRPQTAPRQKAPLLLRLKPGPSEPRRAVGTWVSAKDYDLFVEIAKRHGVNVSTYLRAIINDALAEEGPKVRTLFTD